MAASDVIMRSKSETRSVQSPSGSLNGSPVRPSSDLSYMHRPPTILPNYGKKYRGGLKLKTNVPRVLLYDNVTQQTMLDVQLSGIQSQRYKTGRELEMHMKSFLLRRQHKDKALTKLTKVDHGEDYQEFEQHYYASSVEDLRQDIEGDDHQRLSLPSIHSTNGIGVSIQSMRGRRKGKKRRRSPQVKFLNGLTNGWQHQSSPSYLSEQSAKEDSTLPHINSPHSTGGQAQGQGPTHHFEPRRRVGFRVDKSPAGVTRLFHAFPDDSEQTVNGAAENANLPSEEHSEIGAIHDANQPTETAIPVDTDTSGSEAVQRPPEGAASAEAHSAASGFSRFGHGRNERKGQPVFDQRFELLQQILIRQDPPNEGFTELSPSFVRQYPLHHVGQKLAYLKIGDERTKKEEEDRRSLYSDGVTPVLSDGNLSDSDDESDTHANDRENSALKRLGAI